MSKIALVLSSGGLDSTTLLAIAQSQGFVLHTLTFNYGQRHQCELKAAQELAQIYNVQQTHNVTIDLRAFGGSALTDNIDVPKRANGDVPTSEIPITYVPARNTIFLSYALAIAEVISCTDVFIGVNHVDYSGYPDCRPEFIQAFQTMANLATKAAVEGQTFTIHTPLIQLSKSEIIQWGTQLKVDYSLTHSCYDPIQELACGSCDSCLLRQKGFLQAGVADPTRYFNPSL